MALTKEQWNEQLAVLTRQQELLIARPNPKKESFYNGTCDRYQHPVLTAAHAPIMWRYDLCCDDNPNLQEGLGVNAVMNSGVICLNGKYCLYASSDTRLHVASTTIEKLMDYTFNTPEDPRRSVDCVKQRCDLIDKNLKNGAISI